MQQGRRQAVQVNYVMRINNKGSGGWALYYPTRPQYNSVRKFRRLVIAYRTEALGFRISDSVFYLDNSR